MIRIKEAVVVEGKYDKIKLSALIDGIIVVTDGFGIFRDKEKMEYLRRLAEKQGLVVLTDSDGAGFVIRGKISSCIPPSQLKHAYIPDMPGKEKRKTVPSKAGTLGVEGMDLQTLQEALRRAGATLLTDGGAEPNAQHPAGGRLTKADLFEMGLSGREDSARRRKALQRELGLPAYLSAVGLLQALNALYSEEELTELRERLRQQTEREEVV